MGRPCWPSVPRCVHVCAGGPEGMRAHSPQAPLRGKQGRLALVLKAPSPGKLLGKH